MSLQTHIGIARDKTGLLIGTKFVSSDSCVSMTEQVVQHHPKATEILIIKRSDVTVWHLEDKPVWVEEERETTSTWAQEYYE